MEMSLATIDRAEIIGREVDLMTIDAGRLAALEYLVTLAFVDAILQAPSPDAAAAVLRRVLDGKVLALIREVEAIGDILAGVEALAFASALLDTRNRIIAVASEVAEEGGQLVN